MARWTPEPKVMIPAVNSNKDFIKYAAFYAHGGLKTMAPWTPGSKDLIPPVNSNKDLITHSAFFSSCLLNGPLGSGVRGVDPGHKFQHLFHRTTPSFLLTVDSMDSRILRT